MHEDMHALLNVYLDGELHGPRLLEMKHHLAGCEFCRNELLELQQISFLLQAAPTPEFMPVERFVSNLNLRLPRQEPGEIPQKSVSLAWWLFPAGLLGAWFFIQTVFTLTGMVIAIQTSGLFGQSVQWLGGGQETGWYALVTGFFGPQAGGSQPALSLLNSLDVFGVNLVKGFLWQAFIAFLYLGWLFFWWLRRSTGPMTMDTGS
jgi:hypothetical protein